MSEIRIACWNTLNSFGDERSPQAVEIVKRLDSDIVFLGEMTAKDELGSDYFLEASEAMNELGYGLSKSSDYYPPNTQQRDKHTMGIWARDNLAQSIDTPLLGSRYGIRLAVPKLEAVMYGVHLDDRHESTRLDAAQAIAADWSELGASEAVVFGDLNAMHEADPKSILPRTLGRIVGRLEVKDYYDSSKKLQRFAGKVLRICRMADGSTLKFLADHGLEDADPAYTPTIGRGRTAFQIDHILASQGLVLTNPQVHSRSTSDNHPDISDHSPVSATVTR